MSEERIERLLTVGEVASLLRLSRKAVIRRIRYARYAPRWLAFGARSERT